MSIRANPARQLREGDPFQIIGGIPIAINS
jgi:hypothetical protein